MNVRKTIKRLFIKMNTKQGNRDSDLKSLTNDIQQLHQDYQDMIKQIKQLRSIRRGQIQGIYLSGA